MALEKFPKQPNEVMDYDINFIDWLASLGDTALTHTAAAEAGLTLDKSELLTGVVKFWTSGGTDGVSYKLTAQLTTVAGRTKEYEIIIKVKET